MTNGRQSNNSSKRTPLKRTDSLISEESNDIEEIKPPSAAECHARKKKILNVKS